MRIRAVCERHDCDDTDFNVWRDIFGVNKGKDNNNNDDDYDVNDTNNTNDIDHDSNDTTGVKTSFSGEKKKKKKRPYFVLTPLAFLLRGWRGIGC